MTSRRVVSDQQLAGLLLDEQDVSLSKESSHSGTENIVEVDDIESDNRSLDHS